VVRHIVAGESLVGESKESANIAAGKSKRTQVRTSFRDHECCAYPMPTGVPNDNAETFLILHAHGDEVKAVSAHRIGGG
jgi:hypothetical protein